jgi:two-component system, cell cycle sensor histidine kinase and response regulator CckA
VLEAFMLRLARTNILFRLFLILSLTTFGIGIAFSVHSYHAAMQRMQKDLDYHINSILAYATRSYSLPLWDFNIPNIEKLNESLALNQMVVAVNISSLSYFIASIEKQDFRNNGIMTTPRKEPYVIPAHDQSLRSIMGPILHNDKTIGSIDIIYTDHFIRQDVTKQFRASLMLVFGIAIIALGTTFVILRRSIIQPIMKLSRISKQIAKDQDFTLRISKPSDDEIGILYEGINNLLENVHGRETELKESNNYIMEIINAVADPIFVKNRNHHWIMFNDALCELTGINRENILGKSDFDIFNQAEAAIFYANDELVFTAGINSMNEEILTDARGDIHTIVTKKTLYKNSKGDMFIVGVIRDVTASKQAEAEKLAMEAQLAQARKVESIGQLAGGIAHDFNNMLGVIIGFADMALSGMTAQDPNYDYLHEIMRAAERSSNLTRQLLAFARKQPAAPRILNLNEAIPSALRMLERIIGEGIQLLWTSEPHAWPVLIDPVQLDQILTNLCINARDAISAHGTIAIQLQNRQLDHYHLQQEEIATGAFVCLSVKDDGCGMDSHTLSYIFEPFFTTKGVGKGTGLGLATVYGIVKQNHGFAEAISEPGKGTTFNIYLPRHDKPAISAPAEPAGVAFIGGHETILLVEDEDSMLKMATSMLHGLGFKIIPANGPQEAIEKCHAQPEMIDLLLTDVIMPKMNGCKLAAEIRKIRPEIKTLLMSAYTADVIEQQGVDVSDLQLISKPFGRHQLAKKIRQVLAHT